MSLYTLNRDCTANYYYPAMNHHKKTGVLTPRNSRRTGYTSWDCLRWNCQDYLWWSSSAPSTPYSHTRPPVYCLHPLIWIHYCIPSYYYCIPSRHLSWLSTSWVPLSFFTQWHNIKLHTYEKERRPRGVSPRGAHVLRIDRTTGHFQDSL